MTAGAIRDKKELRDQQSPVCRTPSEGMLWGRGVRRRGLHLSQDLNEEE